MQLKEAVEDVLCTKVFNFVFEHKQANIGIDELGIVFVRTETAVELVFYARIICRKRKRNEYRSRNYVVVAVASLWQYAQRLHTLAGKRPYCAVEEFFFRRVRCVVCSAFLSAGFIDKLLKVMHDFCKFVAYDIRRMRAKHAHNRHDLGVGNHAPLRQEQHVLR